MSPALHTTFEMLIRFAIGGIAVSLFSVVGQVWKPTTFSGIFGAAPSVAVGSLGLTAALKDAHAVATQSPAMIVGALALAAYSVAVALVVRKRRVPTWVEAALMWVVWLGVAAALWAAFLR